MPYAFCEQIGKEIRDISEEIPFDIPESWEWCRLGFISTYNEKKQKINAQNADKSIWGLDLEDIEKGGKLLVKKTVGERKAVGDKAVFRKGDILYSKLRPYLLKILVAPYDGICTPEIVPFTVYGSISAEYIVMYLKSPYVDGLVNGETYGIKMPRAGTETMINLLVPLPPLPEQHRIITKIEELLPYIEKYEQAETQLTTLNTNFPELLKKSILQEAVQGKLVPQNPDDEPASVLLDRIRFEKQKLIKAGKIKKDKQESVIVTRDKIPYEIVDGKERCIADEVPFELPDSWCWCRFGTAVVNRDADRIPLSVSEREKLDKIYDYYGASGVIDKVDKFLFNKPLLLIGEDGANLLLRSKPIAFIAKGEYWVNNHAHVLDAVGGLSMEYICWYINAINLAPYVTGTAQPKMNQEKMNSILVPIPPLQEQHRIAAKIEELMKYCEML